MAKQKKDQQHLQNITNEGSSSTKPTKNRRWTPVLWRSKAGPALLVAHVVLL
jgi:hypothetical protein